MNPLTSLYGTGANRSEIHATTSYFAEYLLLAKAKIKRNYNSKSSVSRVYHDKIAIISYLNEIRGGGCCGCHGDFHCLSLFGLFTLQFTRSFAHRSSILCRLVSLDQVCDFRQLPVNVVLGPSTCLLLPSPLPPSRMALCYVNL